MQGCKATLSGFVILFQQQFVSDIIKINEGGINNTEANNQR